jgi:hypothetical protein
VRIRIGHHRRFTANHTWHVDWRRQALFLKANPHHDEAMAECHGHAKISSHYPVPPLRGHRRVARWTLLVYDRWLHLGQDAGLLLDEISYADLTSDLVRLDRCLTDVLGHYAGTIAKTLRRTTNADTVSKLYGERAAPGGRLDSYYGADRPWLASEGSRRVRPSELAGLRLVVNGRRHDLDFANVVTWLRSAFSADRPVWAAITQGDPTDMNIGWSPQGGPVWFDYDTGGLNAIPGEFACFLLYQRLHGAWLTPHYNPAALRDHPAAIEAVVRCEPVVQMQHVPTSLTIVYRHRPSPARRHVMRRYLDEIVYPVANQLDISDLMEWLRPYLVMRLLAVYDLASLKPRDAGLSIGLLAEALAPTTTLPDFLALTQTRTEVTRPCLVPSPLSLELARASVPPSPHASLTATT